MNDITQIYKNIIAEIKKLESVGETSVSTGILKEAENNIAIRPTPAPNKEKYYQGKNQFINFQVLVKHKSHAEALKIIYDIDNILDDNSTIPDINYLETYTEPTFVEYTEEKYFIYTAQYKAVREEQK